MLIPACAKEPAGGTQPPAESIEVGDAPATQAPAKFDEARRIYSGAEGDAEELRRAGELLAEILAEEPHNTDALTILAQVHLELGEMEEALATAIRCTEISSEIADCWLTIGVIQAQVDENYEVAQQALEK